MHEVADSLTAAIARAETHLSRLSDEDASASLNNGGWSRKQIIGT